MRILGLQIRNFRGIRNASLRLEERTLLVGDNNAGKTTILEALDLVLGPERLRDLDAITEHDFYGSNYMAQTMEGIDDPSLGEKEDPRIEIRVLLGKLTERDRSRFVGHIRPLMEEDRQILGESFEVEEETEKILPVAFHAAYDAAEDEFSAQTVFLWPTPEQQDDLAEYTPLGRSHKRDIGFLYLRSLRTARRAATLQRNSLLDILLRLNEVRPTIWSELLDELAHVRVDLDLQPELKTVIDALRVRLGNYLPGLGGKLSHSRLQVGRLTRRDLRTQVAYFLETGAGNDHSLPFDLFGTGTANLLVLALLRAIADAKQNVIFAMEEPEVAIPPHTQRRVVKDVFAASGQVLFTSHSPYVAERFLDAEILVLQKDSGHVHFGSLRDALKRQDAVKPKNLRRNFRINYAEGLLARATLILEGISEVLAFQAVDSKLGESGSEAYLPTDLSGVVLVDAHGAELTKVTHFFRDVKVPAFPVWDANLSDTPTTHTSSALGQDLPHSYNGLESLVADEVDPRVLREYLVSSAELGRYQFATPEPTADPKELQRLAIKYWKKRKGEGDLAAFLLSLPLNRQPRSLVIRLLKVWAAVTGRRLPANDPLVSLVPTEYRADIVTCDPSTSPPSDETEDADA